MKKFLILAFLILAGLYLYWPYHAVGKYRDALNAGDAAAVSAMVDYAELRKSMRAQTLQKLTPESPRNGATAILSGVMVDKLLDALMDEKAIGTTLAIGKAIHGSEPQQIDTFRWRSLNTVAVTMTGDSAPLTFRLNGTSWKLVGKDVGAMFTKFQSLLSR